MKLWKKMVHYLSIGDSVVDDPIPEVKQASEADLWIEKLSNHPYSAYRIKDEEVDSFMQGVVECFGEWGSGPTEIIALVYCCKRYSQHNVQLKEKKLMLSRHLTVNGKPFMWGGKTFVLDRPVYNKCNMMM